MPADHSTSSVAVDLETLFRMPEVKGDVVVMVGPEAVGKNDLEQALRALQLEVGAAGAPGDITRYEVLRAAVDRLAENARRRLFAKELGITLDEARVKEWLRDLEARMDANPSFKVFLMRAGKDAPNRRIDAERTVLWQQVQDAVIEQVMVDSESIARSHYDKNLKQFTDHAGVEAWRIVLKAPRGLVQRDRDIARTRAEKIHARAVADPSNFENLARQNSSGGKGPHGGYLGYVARGSLAKEVEKGLFSAKPETILPLHEAPAGFYIYKVGRSRPERVKPFDSVKKDILRQVYPAKLSRRVTEHMKRLRGKYPTEEKIPELAVLEEKERARIEAVKAKLRAGSPGK